MSIRQTSLDEEGVKKEWVKKNWEMVTPGRAGWRPAVQRRPFIHSYTSRLAHLSRRSGSTPSTPKIILPAEMSPCSGGQVQWTRFKCGTAHTRINCSVPSVATRQPTHKPAPPCA